MNLNTLTVGLFGTCGSSRWREPFITEYEKLGIPCFNPQVADWKPEFAEIEAWHLANDQLLLFPVTAETYGTGSLAETGFSILSALRWNANRFVILYIEPTVDSILKEQNALAAKESERARKLVIEHMKKAHHPNVFIVDSLEAMLQASIPLFSALKLISSARNGSDADRLTEDPSWLEALGPYYTSRCQPGSR